MATVKFKDASPYVKPKPSPPKDDYLYNKYLENFALKTEKEPIVKVALFGVGRAGTIHLATMNDNKRIQILYIVDDVESNWQSIRKYWHLDNVTFLNSKQSDRVFKDPNVDAVFVASPTYTHENIVIKALEAKKAVFCEKPIAEDRPSTVKCYEIAKKVGKPLFTAFNRRFDPSYSNVKERVRKGEVGHVHMIKTVSRDSPLPSLDYLKLSGGIFHDCLVHDIDMITWILGEYPDKVSVLAHANIPEIKTIDDFDTVAVVLHFSSGTVGMIDLSRNSSYGYDQRLEVFGPKGMVQADNEQLNSVHSQHDVQGIATAPIWYSFASRFKNGYLREFDHFIDVIHGKAESQVKSKEILAVSKIATACEESARKGKVVDLTWTKDELPDNP
ncbi:PREDICTED: inositol 2-dehydrogenase-like [Cyphomyrmex costatus]|uniref:Putative oxidoreductase yrbE n=1 Tax=Cyphomyrmex costatus TaxID=456900 RepID=A0A151IEN6_9HYME|nr:PREDICTED: inositol 2-dehydrogenase-like [Cyphomyrmex costatus]KYM99276.1 putative oxidoreductase yrbE [Cyphomyrmex costatus]